MTGGPIIKAFGDWVTNGEMIAGAARLGGDQPYLGGPGAEVIDMSWGRGTFWTEYRPKLLTRNDLDPETGATHNYDVRAFPKGWAETFDVAVWDGPYKLNGTPTPAEIADIDARYGVGEKATMAYRHELLIAGTIAAAELVRPNGTVLVKCQDQICSGAYQPQERMVAEAAELCGLKWLDKLLFPSYRPQPAGRRQVHSRRNYSTLLIFRKPNRKAQR